jgi:ornithine decarboxylase
MGGGFPASYISKTNEMKVYAEEITRYLQEDFEDDFPEVILEPGRSLVAEAGVLVSEVVLISQKSTSGVDKWLYQDAGKFNGLIETFDESIKYPLYCEAPGNDCEDYIIAGPTCDSQDIMYEYFRNPLPSGINIGDRIYWLTCGAYTSSYASVEFNGFPPIKTYFLKDGK